MLGKGVALSGLSAISRVGGTFYMDGEKTGVQLNNYDNFAPWNDRFDTIEAIPAP